jgi:hypothetical protein
MAFSDRCEYRSVRRDAGYCNDDELYSHGQPPGGERIVKGKIAVPGETEAALLGSNHAKG